MQALDYSQLLDEIEIDKELSSRSYRHFIPTAWKWVEPSQPFKHNWHIDAVADHLEAVFNGEIKDLVINVPPSTTKSLSACVFFPSWAWTKKPGYRSIFGSYSEKLAMRDSLRCRDLIESNWYQERWGDTVVPNTNNMWTASRFANKAGGSRVITTPAGGITGEHAHLHLVDDPIKPFEATGSLRVSETAQERVDRWWGTTMTTRVIDIETIARVIMMQRLASNDLAGKMIEQGYELLMLPMEFEPKRKCFTCIGFEDPRTEEKEILDSVRFPREALEKDKVRLGPRAVKAQYQQDPAPSEGTIFKDRHFRQRFKKYPVLPDGEFIQSWDCTFSDTGDSYVVGQVWACSQNNYYLFHEVRNRLTFTKTVKAIKNLTNDYPNVTVKLIEKKANGDAVIDSLKEEINGLVPIVPTESKAARANAVEILFEMGQVWLPDEDLAPWIIDYEKEMKNFTGEAGEKNDRVDATTQALMYFMRHHSNRNEQAINNMKSTNLWM